MSPPLLQSLVSAWTRVGRIDRALEQIEAQINAGIRLEARIMHAAVRTLALHVASTASTVEAAKVVANTATSAAPMAGTSAVSMRAADQLAASRQLSRLDPVFALIERFAVLGYAPTAATFQAVALALCDVAGGIGHRQKKCANARDVDACVLELEEVLVVRARAYDVCVSARALVPVFVILRKVLSSRRLFELAQRLDAPPCVSDSALWHLVLHALLSDRASEAPAVSACVAHVERLIAARAFDKSSGIESYLAELMRTARRSLAKGAAARKL